MVSTETPASCVIELPTFRSNDVIVVVRHGSVTVTWKVIEGMKLWLWYVTALVRVNSYTAASLLVVDEISREYGLLEEVVMGGAGLGLKLQAKTSVRV